MSSREFHFQPRWINGKIWPAVKQLTDNCFPNRPHRTVVSKRSEASQGVAVSARAWAPVGRGVEGLCWQAGQVVSLSWGDRAEQEEDVQIKGSMNLHRALLEPWDEFSATFVNLGKEQLHGGAAVHCQRARDPPEQRDCAEHCDLAGTPVGSHLCCRINLPERKHYSTPTYQRLKQASGELSWNSSNLTVCQNKIQHSLKGDKF